MTYNWREFDFFLIRIEKGELCGLYGGNAGARPVGARESVGVRGEVTESGYKRKQKLKKSYVTHKLKKGRCPSLKDFRRFRLSTSSSHGNGHI